MASIQQFPIGVLAESGLHLQAAFPLASLDADLLAPVHRSQGDLSPFKTLVLLGQAGPSFYESIVSKWADTPDPFDDAARQLVSAWFADNAPAARWSVVYPGDALVPLGRLAELGGWGRASPLGLTINPEYGLWVAHRLAFVTDIVWDYRPESLAHPCDTCVDRPCESACPAGAVSLVAGFNLRACAEHRAPEGSECEYQCLARNACPVGSQYRYGPQQMHHHYSSGLKSVRKWLAEGL